MKAVLIDGSNVTLHTAGPGKLESLDCLARVVHALVWNGILPYTVFDASFRYRLAESKPGRKEFDRLTREVKRYFQMSPRGEKADLFLLEFALGTGFPILSDDTFQDYGGVEDGFITYQSERLAVLNFQVIASTVVIPDLGLRFRSGKDHGSLDGIERALAELEAKGEAEDAAVELAAGEAVLDADDKRHLEIDAATVDAIGKVLEGYVEGGSKPLGRLGALLTDYKQAFREASGVGKTSKRVWFGFPSLSDFVRKTFPGYRVEGPDIHANPGVEPPQP